MAYSLFTKSWPYYGREAMNFKANSSRWININVTELGMKINTYTVHTGTRLITGLCIITV